MNLRTVLPPVVVVVLGFGALSGVQNTGFREQIEATLTESAEEALAGAGRSDVAVELTGRDAEVTAATAVDALVAAEIVGDVTGVRTAAAYGPEGLVPPGSGTTQAHVAGEDEETGEAQAEPTASPEATEATSDDGTDETTDDESDDETSTDDSTDDSTEESTDDETAEPDREPTRKERERAQEDLVEIPSITFVTDSARLTKDGRRVVREAAEVLEEHPEVEVRIEGHTDSVGTEAHNQRLSERRAQAVLDRLVELGVDADRLTSKGYGESDPLVVPRTFADLEQNRRVEFVVTR
ncbi:OmpA family protein [Promicromonospora sp. MS192]|uniref:OmpA family protein n=1 Tax=Promicromonospora sp. MS192 TaxID=3412684 RepID=UPI003C2CE854